MPHPSSGTPLYAICAAEGATCVAEPPLAPFTGAAAVLCVALGAALAWGAVGGGSGAVKAAVVGAGAVEYAWGKADKQKFRRDINDRVAAHLHKNIVKCFSRLEKFLPLARVSVSLLVRHEPTAVCTERVSPTLWQM